MRDDVPGVELLNAAAADVLLLTDIDFDAGQAALAALNDSMAFPYPHVFSKRPNSGLPTGLDLDKDGFLGGPRDAQGYGWFSGQGGQAILSRWPIRLRADYSDTLWQDSPNTAMRSEDTGRDVQRLSSTAHWAVEIAAPLGEFTLLTVGATPPVFDGPEDRNGRRNRDEVLLWHHVLGGTFGEPIDGAAVVLGNLNLDPTRGDGIRDAVRDLLQNQRLRDPLPGLPTVEWDKVGKMRVSYVLPTTEFRVIAAGVIPPEEGAGPHGLVWADLAYHAKPGQ
ncbi:endonuclease/exonuclease/phosphatase family protein [Thalassococcus lentus]|uniref:Endonuclease/exonuclease/phosphatase family protein n=1 Tax=Thalassococcus lentus TaxID=1210524 RepID=A0ABT4XNM3_9RHOB|nr:endonuclease/exonuclease/phosphatase family protein [Thalassococcus lentus]MDA7423547.1 endonuclease/exonuclease/phosphatase family protein [Thalassococcus lentus]